MATARPVRAMDPYGEQFWAFTLEKELRLQKCSDCGKFRWPPGPTCDRCLSDEFEWTAVSGAARVLSWTTFRRGYFEEYPPPHTILALELEEGPLFISYPVDVEVTELREGMTLELRWTDGGDRFGEYNLPVFGPPSGRTMSASAPLARQDLFASRLPLSSKLPTGRGDLPATWPANEAPHAGLADETLERQYPRGGGRAEMIARERIVRDQVQVSGQPGE